MIVFEVFFETMIYLLSDWEYTDPQEVRRIRSPDYEMAMKLEMHVCGSQSLCWEGGVTGEQGVVLQWILGDCLHGHLYSGI